MLTTPLVSRARAPQGGGPTIRFSTFLNGAGRERVSATAIGPDGSVYVAGETDSADFPLAAALQPSRAGGKEAFVARIASDGASLLFATYIGGAGDDTATGIAVDATGVYVVGQTTSLDFPTTPGAHDRVNGRFPTCSGPDCIDSFVVKLALDGSRFEFATDLGGEHDDYATAIAVDATGEALVTGSTNSFGFPRDNAFNPRKKGGAEAFITRLSADGSRVVHSSYIGGNRGDGGFAVAVDGEGNAYVAGDTFSTDFETLAPFQAAHAGPANGGLDTFLAKVRPDGTLAFATYLGGDGDDVVRGIAVAGPGRVAIAGRTRSESFPLAPGPRSEADAFVAVVDADGDAVVAARAFGGTGDDEALGVGVDGAGTISVAGVTRSADLPTVSPLQPVCGGCGAQSPFADVFVASFDATLESARFATYLGGRASEESPVLAVSPGGDLVVGGATASPDFPTTPGAFQPTCGCGAGSFSAGFVARIGSGAGSPDGPVVAAVAVAKRPFRLVISGGGFQAGASVFLGDDDEPWSPVVVGDDRTITVGGGKRLKQRLPKGVAVRIRVVNPDGGEAETTVTR